jgi:hypothetical protein
MNRLACWLLASSLLLSGCGGEPDRSRVIPVTDDDSKPRPASKLPDDQLTPQKIPMH